MNLKAWLEETAARAASAGDYESAAELLTLANAVEPVQEMTVEDDYIPSTTECCGCGEPDGHCDQDCPNAPSDPDLALPA